MYTTLKYILDDAAKNNYGVIAGCAINMETARGLITAAHEEDAPLIIITGQGQMTKHARAELMVPLIKTLAEKTPVPVALCLDHGKDFERITHAFRNGFSSVMIDGSAYDMAENIKQTQKVVELCHSQGIAVEGELGHVGVAATHDGRDESLYTKPEDAKYFVDHTHVDCLAIAVGTAHGKYPKGFVPHINFDRIREVKKAINNMPIALHGGSGSGDENIRKAVAAGINKINVATDILCAYRDRAAELISQDPNMDIVNFYVELEQAVKKVAKHWIQLSQSSGKAGNFKPVYYFEDEIAKTYNAAGE
jgi:fructose-bisphosphate aldolase, class II